MSPRCSLLAALGCCTIAVAGPAPKTTDLALRLPGFRDTSRVRPVESNPFTPLTRLSSGGLDYLVPSLQAKITGISISDEGASVVYDGRDIYVGSSITFERRADNAILPDLVESFGGRAAPGNSAGKLVVRRITANEVVFSDDSSGLELAVPVATPGDVAKVGDEAPARNQFAQSVRLGILSNDGRSVAVMLPRGVDAKTRFQLTSRNNSTRQALLDHNEEGFAVLKIEGKPAQPSAAADTSVTQESAHVLHLRSGADGLELLSGPCPAERSPAGTELSGAVVCNSSGYAGFVDGAGRIVPLVGFSGVQGVRSEEGVFLVIFTSTAPSAASSQ